jgi:hypothetical protein
MELAEPAARKRSKDTRLKARFAQMDSRAVELPVSVGVLERLFYPALIFVCVLVTCIRLVSEPDSWFHMAFGRYVLNHHALPPGDIFSFTGFGNEWISTGWAPSLLMHLLFTYFRSNGLVWLVFAVVLPAVFLPYFVSVRYYGARGSAGLTSLALIAATYLRFSPRPEIFSLLCICCESLLLVSAERAARRQEPTVARGIYLLPLLMAVWANLHGGFVIGFLPLGAFGLQRARDLLRRRTRADKIIVLVCAVSAVSWLANPYTYQILKLVFDVVHVETLHGHLYEYMSLFKGGSAQLPFATLAGTILVTALCGIAMYRDRKSVALWQAGVAAAFVLLELHERRHLGMASFTLVALSAPHLHTLDSPSRNPRLAWPVASLLLAALILYLKYSGALGVGPKLLRTGRDSNLLPKTAVEYMQENRPPANMFNTYGPGGYLLYFLGPQTKVFIDGRFFVYDEKIWTDFLAAQDGTLTIEELCSRYDIKSFFIYIKDGLSKPNHLANRLTARDDFKLIYFGDVYALFVRDLPETEEYLRSREFHYITPFLPERSMAAILDPHTRKLAMDELKRAEDISQNSAVVSTLEVMAYRRLGKPQKASKVLTGALKRFPRNRVLRRLALQQH